MVGGERLKKIKHEKDLIRKPDPGEIELLMAQWVINWIMILQERGLIE